MSTVLQVKPYACGAWRRLAMALSSFALGACATVGPDYQRPAVPVPAQYGALENWKPAQPEKAASDDAWWSVYDDAELDRLERQLSVSNQSLKASEANYRQAQALVAEAKAGYFPGVTVSAGGQRSRNNTASGPLLSDQDSASLGASWAPDIWGKIRRSVEASHANAQVSADDLAAARLSLQTTLASDYFALRTNDELARLYQRTIVSYEATLNIVRNQFEAGTAAQTDVITAQTQLLGVQAQLKGLGVQRSQLEHALAVLVGQTPEHFHVAVAADFAPNIPVAPPGLPSDLLERRPDVAAAEQTVAATNAQIGVAEAAYFPNLTLTASVGGAANTLARVLQTGSRVWAVGPQLAETLFDGGLRAGQVDAARAAFDASAANYRQTVLTAFAQVEDNLAALHVLQDQADIQKLALQSAQEAVALTVNQYEAGTVAYTSVVTVEAIALNDEINVVNTSNSRLSASVALIGALGGGWHAQGTK